MSRQLISSEEAVPATEQHKRPCSDCPMARKSLPGWLGGSTVSQWLSVLHSDSRLNCHVLEGAQCAGGAIYRANVGKRPRDGSVLRLVPDEETCFSSAEEFAAHHSGKP